MDLKVASNEYKRFLSFIILTLLTLSPGIVNSEPLSGDSIPFSPGIHYPAATRPYHICISDLNADGDQDLAVAMIDGKVISIFMNNGDGTFAPKVDYDAGSGEASSFGPTSVFAADLDGDADLDLAVSNFGSLVTVLKNNGDGTFGGPTGYATNDGCTYVTSSDLDSDGDKDLAAVSYGGCLPYGSVLLNNGDGTFAPKVDYDVGSCPRCVVTADLDGDTDQDLAVSHFGDLVVSVLLNNGNGTFAPKTDLAVRAVGGISTILTAADLDNDGDIDLAVDNEADTVSVFKNDGSGTFAPRVDYQTGDNPVSVFASDMDGDGYKDILTANFGGTISILKNDGSGAFATRTDYAAGTTPFSVSAADLEGDGDNDLAVTSYWGQSITILENLSIDNCLALQGDANASGTHTLGDVIQIVKYVFNRPGCLPLPSCWLSDLICRGDWNGDISVSLVDVIWAVNYIFNKPDGPWTPVVYGDCCFPAP